MKDAKKRLENLQLKLRRITIGGAVFFGTGELCSLLFSVFEKLSVPEPFRTLSSFLLSIVILFWFLFKFGHHFFKPSETPLVHVEDENTIAEVFERLGLRRPRVVWVPQTAMVCGIVGAVPFLTKFLPPPSLVVSEHWRKNLSSQEFKMVVAHEAAHAKMGHIPFRMLFTGVALFLAQMGLFASFFSLSLFFDDPYVMIQPCFFASLPILFIFALPYFGYLRSQETEADLRAVFYFPEGKQDLIRALEKTQSLIGTQKRLIKTHPSIIERISALNNYNPIQKPKSSLRAAASTFAMHAMNICILFGVLAYKSAPALEFRQEIESGNIGRVEVFIQNRNPRVNQYTFGVPYGSPLLLAIQLKNSDMVKLLTAYGANPDLNYTIKSGSAREFASRLNWNEGIAALKLVPKATRTIAQQK